MKNLIYIGVEPHWTLSNFASMLFISDERRPFEIIKKTHKFLIFIEKVIYFVGFMQQQVSEKYLALQVPSGTRYQT